MPWVYSLTNIGNDKIQWESTKKLNFGLQSYLLNNRVGLTSTTSSTRPTIC